MKRKTEEAKYDIEDNITEDVNDDDNDTEYYDWTMIPHCNTEDRKTGVTFKGDTVEYLAASKRIFDLFNEKGRKLTINSRKIRILDNAKNKSIKVDIKPKKGPSGKVNVKIYGANKAGYATIMITKTKEYDLLHVKSLAFRIVKYLLDGMIDGVIKEKDLNNFKDSKNKHEDDEASDSNLFCYICRQNYKTKNGKIIHMEKIHGIMIVCCDHCGKDFVSEDEFNVHMQKDHDESKEFKCEKCSFLFQDEDVLNKHIQNCCEIAEVVQAGQVGKKCDYCDLKIWSGNDSEVRKKMLDHHKTCTSFPQFVDVSKEYNCKECDYKTANEDNMKRHNRDKHGAVNVSTSPKHKKRKHTVNVENMDVDYPSIEAKKCDIDSMEIDDPKDILTERSKKWDEKVMRKNEKNDQEMQKFFSQKEEKEKREKSNKGKNKKHAIRMKSKLKNNEEKHGEKPELLKPYLKEIPQTIKKIIGEDFYLYPVVGDGACGLRAVAGWLFQDPSQGPYLGRNINEHYVSNWKYWKQFFAFPFEREVGNGEKKVFKTEKELFEFLRNSKDGAYMWRDHEDFAAICNIYQLKIKIITVGGWNDPNPVVSNHEPDPNFESNDMQFPPGKISDMILYHLKDVHFDLIVRKDSIIAKEGGLDFQRKSKNEEKRKANETNDEEKESVKERALLERKITNLEAQLETLLEKIRLLEAEKQENVKLSKDLPQEKVFSCYECDESYKTKTSIREHMEIHIKHETLNCNKCKTNFITNKSFEEHISNHNKNDCKHCGTYFWTEKQLEKHIREQHVEKEEGDDKIIQDENKCTMCGKRFEEENNLKSHIEMHHKKEEFNCTKCKSIFSSEKRLVEHMESHEQNQCESQHCGKTFRTKIQLENHVLDHNQGTGAQKLSKQYNCNDCPFQGDNWSSLKKHIQSLQHNPVEFCEKCYTCGLEFSSYWQLMDHRKQRHPSNRKCRYYARQECLFNAEKCWYRHEDFIKESGNFELDHSCKECEEKFQNRSQLMMHKRKEHADKIERCRKYLQGTCDRDAKLCWFLHGEGTKDVQIKEIDEDDSSKMKSVFHMAKEIAPPDPLKTIMELVTKLLEERTLNQKNQ